MSSFGVFAKAGSISIVAPSGTLTPHSLNQRVHLATRSWRHVAGESAPSAFLTGENSSARSKATLTTVFASGRTSKRNF